PHHPHVTSPLSPLSLHDALPIFVPVAAIGLPAAFALYTGSVVLLVNLATHHLRLPGAARIVLFAIAWTAAEWVRGHAFTGLPWRSEEHTSELQSRFDLVCRLLLE